MKSKDQILLESAYENVIEEAKKKSYSAKKARGGKDIGKPGKNFKKIAKKAAEEYGSEEAGKRVAGAVLKKLREESENNSEILSEERHVPPADWDKGFEFPIKIGSGGKEIPFKKNGKWYLYVWDSKINKHFYYCYEDDIYHPDTEFGDL
jgi:hypothetical protein